MTREELREHCEKQVEACLDWHKVSGRPLGLMYEEHKLILDLLDQDADKEKRLEELLESLQTANKTNETLIKLLEGKQKPCEDAVSQKLDEWDLCGKRAELWIIRGKLQIRYMGTIHNINYPPVTPTRKHGEWEREEFDIGANLPVRVGYKCSECGNYSDSKFKFCPSCGADMRGGEDGGR